MFFFCLFFLEVESPRALPAAMVLYVWEKCCLIDKLDKLLWTTFQTGVAIDSSALPSLRRGHLCANDYRTHRSAGTMGHGPFHCLSPWLTSGARGLLTFFAKSAPPSAVNPQHSQWQHTSNRFNWLNHNISIVCMYVYVLAVCTEGYSWSTMAGLAYIFVVNGAILNLIFK